MAHGVREVPLVFESAQSWRDDVIHGGTLPDVRRCGQAPGSAVASTAVNDQSGEAAQRAAPSARMVDAGKRALSAGRFDDARSSFEAALGEQETPEAHEGLGWAAVWRDDVTAGIGSFEQAHRLYLDQQDQRGAGRVALWLVYSHGYIRGEPAVAAGWGERAFRLLDGLAPGPEHVWLAVVTAAGRFGDDTGEARRLVRDAAEIARLLTRPDLEAMGLASEGLVLVYEGEVPAGMRLLDEAAAVAIASDSPDFAAVGHTCCAMLAACELACDVERASEWCDRTTEYARRYGFRPLYATCRTSYAGVLIWCGRWPEAEAELLRAESEFAAVRVAARGQPIVRLADLRRRQGRFAEAAELLAQVEGSRAALLTLAALAFDIDDSTRARDLAERYLRQTPLSSRAERAVALELLVSAGARLGEPDAVEYALEELTAIAASFPSDPLRARASRSGGRIAEARGSLEEARRLFEDAVDQFSRCGAPFECAHARLDLARVLRACERHAAASEEALAARDAFERLGALHGVQMATRFLTDSRAGDGRRRCPDGGDRSHRARARGAPPARDGAEQPPGRRTPRDQRAHGASPCRATSTASSASRRARRPSSTRTATGSPERIARTGHHRDGLFSRSDCAERVVPSR